MGNFDNIAKTYDNDKTVARSKMVAENIRSYVVDGVNKTAMDYGCGTGLVGFELMEDFKSVLFVDSSLGMIEKVREKLINSNKSVSDALCCDFITDAPNGLKFDCIFSSFAFHHIVDIENIVSILFNMLNENGQLIIVDMDKNNHSFHSDPHFNGHNGFEQTALGDIAKKIGFAKVESKSFLNGKKIIDGAENEFSLFILNAVK